MKKNLTRIVLGLLLGLLFLGHAARLYQVPLLNTLDAFVYDARLRLTMPGGVDERIVILDIDERSLAEQGRWPWSRDKMAQLITRLFDDYGIAIIGFDVVFAEPDGSSGLRSLDSLASGELRGEAAFQSALSRLRGSLDYDRRFADALRGRPVVLGYYFNNSVGQEHRSGLLPAPAIPEGTFKGKTIAFTRWNG